MALGAFDGLINLGLSFLLSLVMFGLGFVVVMLCGIFAIRGRRVPAIFWYAVPGAGVIVAELAAIYGLWHTTDAVSLVEQTAAPAVATQGVGMLQQPLGVAYVMFGLTMAWASLWSAAAIIIIAEGKYRFLRTLSVVGAWSFVTGLSLIHISEPTRPY